MIFKENSVPPVSFAPCGVNGLCCVRILFSFRIKQPEYLLDYSQVGVYSVHRSRICWFNEPSVYSRALNGSGFCFFEIPEYGRGSGQRGCVLAVCVGDFLLPPAILTPSLAYAIFFIEPYGGWRDGNCTLSCINHISALFLSKSGICLLPITLRFLPRKTLLKSSLQHL